MAGYKDNLQYLTNFNPYIQQLPVEAMVSVGMQKQQMYNEGIQKIQTNLDNIAGLDVIRNIDKKYLQSKLNEVGNNLKFVAAGDFSDFQLVNSTSGMVNQIAKDRHVVNAVSNSARYRKEASLMEEARKKGESSPSNEYVFHKDAAQWLQSDDLKADMTAKYDKYTNWKKNALEVIKGLTGDETITDNAFTTDSKGNLVLADANVRTKLAGVTPEQIQQALNVGLTPSDFKQMQIDGRYSYANVDPETFMSSVTESYGNNTSAMLQKRDVLSNALSSTTSVPEKEKLNQQIASIDKYVNSMKSEYEDVSNSFASGDIEAAKAKLYTSKQMNGFASAFSHTETSITYEGGTPQDMEKWRQDKAQDWKKFVTNLSQDERHFQINTKLAEARLALDAENTSLKKEENRLKKVELEGYGGTPFTVDQKDVPEVTLAKKTAEVQQNARNIKTADAQFIAQEGKDQAWLDQQRSAWLAKPSSVDPKVAYHFNKIEAARRQNESDMVMLTNINKQAVAQVGDITKHIPADIKTVVATYPTGKMSLSPKELIDFNNKINKYAKYYSAASTTRIPMGTSNPKSFDDAKAKQELSPKEYYLYQLYKKESMHGNLTSGESFLLGKAREVGKRVNLPYKDKIKQINDITANELKKRLVYAQGVEYDMPTASAAQKTTIASRLTSLANLSETQKGGLANSPEFDPKTARLIAGDNNSRYNFKVVEGTSNNPAMYEMTATDSKGNVVKARLTPEQKRAAFGNMFEASPEARAARPYQEQIRKMGGYSTALAPGQTNVKNSYLNKLDFPNTSIYGVTGNIETPDGGNSYTIRLNVYDPIKGKWIENIPYPPSGMVSEDQLTKAMQGLNDSSIFQMLTGKIATSQTLNQIKNISKKPL